MVCDTVRMYQPNPRTLGAEELVLSHFSLAQMQGFAGRTLVAGELNAHIAVLATGMRKFL